MRKSSDCSGAAMIEFLALSVVVALPLAYVLLAVFDVQRAAYGTDAATREAARVFIRADSTAEGERAARAAAALSLKDHGIELDPTSLVISCTATPCLTPGARVRVAYETEVSLPYLPPFVPDRWLQIPIQSHHEQVVDTYLPLRP